MREAKREGGRLRPWRLRRVRPPGCCSSPAIRPAARLHRSFVDLLDQPVAGAEFLAVDTETNGLAGDLCELTEVGAVLVGGGELHDTFDSLVRTERPADRAGSSASPASPRRWSTPRRPRARSSRRSASCSRGRVMVAHSATLRRARPARGVRALRPRLAQAAGALHRPARAPLRAAVPARALAPLADSLGIEVDRGPPRAAGRAHLRARAVRAVPAPVRERVDRRRGAGGAARAAAARARPSRPSASRRPSARTCRTLPDDPGVYIFRDDRGRPLYVGKSVSLRSRARAHFCAPAGWTERAEIVDYRPTNSELGALVLENRLIKQWKPTGNKALKRTDRYCYLRCRLDIPYPVLEVASEPAPGHAVNVGPLRLARARAGAGRPADLALPPAPLRAQAPARASTRRCTGRWGAARRPASETSTRTPTARQLDLALAHFERPGAGEALLRGARPAHGRGGRRPALRAGGGAAAPARAAGLGAGAARGRPARDPRGAAAGAGAAPGQGALRRVLGGARPPGRLGGAARATPSCWSAPARRSPTPRAAPSCRSTRSTRSGSWRAGWPTTSRPSCRSTPRRARRR